MQTSLCGAPPFTRPSLLHSFSLSRGQLTLQSLQKPVVFASQPRQCTRMKHLRAHDIVSLLHEKWLATFRTWFQRCKQRFTMGNGTMRGYSNVTKWGNNNNCMPISTHGHAVESEAAFPDAASPCNRRSWGFDSWYRGRDLEWLQGLSITRNKLLLPTSCLTNRVLSHLTFSRAYYFYSNYWYNWKLGWMAGCSGVGASWPTLLLTYAQLYCCVAVWDVQRTVLHDRGAERRNTKRAGWSKALRSSGSKSATCFVKEPPNHGLLNLLR